MTLGCRFSQTALAIALAVLASPASAEAVTLVCQNDGPAPGVGTFALRVDYDRKIVDMPNSADLARPVGTAFYSAAPTITAGAVDWDVVINPKGAIFRGSLNRLSGQGWVSYSTFYSDGRQSLQTLSGPCRRATQKF
jgi:hypothetical protein